MSRYRFWTPEEQQFLERNCKAMDIEAIGNKLNRSVIAVKLKAENMGLTLKGAEKIRRKEKYKPKIISFTTGDIVQVKYLRNTERLRSVDIKGRVIFKSKYIAVIKTVQGYTEGINLNDMRCGRIKVERM
ncbi:hypothetical protein [Clostridium niameyense]|uniref:hypothetical protein n=1 Tax=Clostridium niameyense TaxID=1622073 RepID=UPI00067E8711|nr:hypothetical protein [Clostridium niameyense]